MVVLKIKNNGVWTNLPAPVSYDLQLSDIQSANSGRNDSGVMTMEVVRKDVASISVEWKMLTTTEFDNIMTLINKKEIDVRYYTGINNSSVAKYSDAVMYRGDRQSKLTNYDDTDPRWELSLKLVEY